MAAVVADLGECGKSSLAKGEWSGGLDLSLAYQRIGDVLQTAPGGLALEQVSSEVLAGVMFCMGVKTSPQLLSRTREHTLDAWSEALSSGPRQKGADLIAGVPGGSLLGNAMGVRALLEAEKMAVAMLLALGAGSSASLAEIGFRRLPYLAPPLAAAGEAAAVVPASFPMEGMGRLVDLGTGGGWHPRKQLSCWVGCTSPGRPTTGTDLGGRSRRLARPSRSPRRPQTGSSGLTRRLPPGLGSGSWGRRLGTWRAIHGGDDDSDET